MYGSGINMQQCHIEIFIGINFKANDFLQAIHRVYRFLQDQACQIHLIYATSEIGILQVLKKKWANHDKMVEKMTDIIKKYGLSHAEMMKELERSIGVERIEVSGKNFIVANNDSVFEAFLVESDSIGLIHTSIPFANHYEYTPSYNDFGFSQNNAHFWQQMDYLTPELYRILIPGRVAAIHKCRRQFSNQVNILSDFYMMVIIIDLFLLIFFEQRQKFFCRQCLDKLGIKKNIPGRSPKCMSVYLPLSPAVVFFRFLYRNV